MKTIKCRRCGTCCMKGGPVLHGDDLPLVKANIIRPEQLVVLRKGEPAYNPGSDRVAPTSCEMLKIQGKAGSWECFFYDASPKCCTIHDKSPLECRLLQCRDTAAVLAVTGKDCLTRRDLMDAADPAAPFVEALEHCSWQVINDLLQPLTASSCQEIEKILRTDLLWREKAVTTLNLSLAQELFYFGRPMFQAFHHPDLLLTMENGLPRLRLV